MEGGGAGPHGSLTTHYMAEADELCERIAIVDHGRILAIGSPTELKHRVQAESIFRLELDRLDSGAGAVARLPGVVSATTASGDGEGAGDERQTVELNIVLRDDGALGEVVSALGGLGSHILGLRKSEPTLEDVFVELVGRGFEENGLEAGSGSQADKRQGASAATATQPEAADRDEVA